MWGMASGCTASEAERLDAGGAATGAGAGTDGGPEGACDACTTGSAMIASGTGGLTCVEVWR
eukprot:5550076-Alexandrium_andersonii.AAC.1